MNIFKLASIFIKLSEVADVLLARNPDKKEFIEYLISINSSNDVIYWALEQEGKGFTEEEVEEAIEFYDSNKHAFSNDITKYNVGFILSEKNDIENLDKLDIDFGSHISEPRLKDQLEKYFKDNNIRLISSSSGVFLGEGAFGTVFEGSYKNKRCALKITNSYDAYGYMSVNKLVSKMPAKVAKSFPIIYKIDEINADRYCIIMELLQPKPSGIGLEGWGRDSAVSSVEVYGYLSKYFEQLKEKMPEIFSAIANKLWPDADKNIFSMSIVEVDYKSIIDRGLKASVYRGLFNDNKVPIILSNVVTDVVKEALKIVAKHVLDMPKPKQKEFSDIIFPNGLYNAIDKFESESWFYLNGIINNSLGLDRGFFNRSFRTSDYTVNEIADNKLLNDLQYSLNWCLNNLGLEYDDVHHGNVMYRPSTNSLVVVDVGLFRVSGQ